MLIVFFTFIIFKEMTSINKTRMLEINVLIPNLMVV